jgi:conjugal transfer pilus assembly protein TraB
MNKLKLWFTNLEPAKKGNVIKYSVIAVVVTVVLGYYFASGEDEKRAEEQAALQEGLETEEVLDNFDLMKEDVSETFRSQLDQQDQAIDAAVTTATDANAKTDQILRELAAMRTALQKEEKQVINTTPQADDGYFEMPAEQMNSYVPPPAFRSNDNLEVAEPPKIIGSIGRAQGVRQMAEKKSQQQHRFYLPMSFAPAISLHGLRIVTSEGAMANPEQLLIRIQAPSVLPNKIKANLEGCFVMTSVTGHLAKKRVDPQLVSLSCLDKDGKSVIEEKVQGYVVDSDGNKGMSANIVSEMSDFVWRALLTGTIGGVGEGVNLSGVQSSVSGLGAVQTFDPDRMAQSALGSGLKNGADAIEEIFIDLAKQHAPVAEVGSAKHIQVVFQTGTWLNIKSRYETVVSASAK